jgi:hypothetical protein
VQFEIDIDGVHKFVAGITGEGHLGVHINTRPASSKGTLDVSGYENISEDETIFLKWPQNSLATGSSVTVRCVEALPVQQPSARRSSKDDARICISIPNVAAEVHARIQEIDERLLALLPIVEVAESPENFKKFQLAVATTLSTISDNFLGPLYNAHSNLRPEELRGVPL